MSKPQFFDIVASFAPAINAALSSEFGVTKAFQDNPQSGETFCIWVPGQYRRVGNDQIAIMGEVWLIRGYDSFIVATQEQVGYQQWLEHSFPTVRQTLIDGLTGAARHTLGDFYSGGYSASGAVESNPTVSSTLSSLQYGAKQKAPWCLTLRCGCCLVLNVRQCY